MDIWNKVQTFLSAYSTVVQDLFSGKEVVKGLAYEFCFLSLMNF